MSSRSGVVSSRPILDPNVVSDEARLKEKLRAIEALFAGATTPGERGAAGAARDRIRERIEALKEVTPIEVDVTRLDRWNHRLFQALAKRYGVKTYRYKGQRRSTIVVRAPEPFLKEVLFPEFDRMSQTLDEHLDAVARRVIAEVLESDPPTPEEPPQLSLLDEASDST